MTKNKKKTKQNKNFIYIWIGTFCVIIAIVVIAVITNSNNKKEEYYTSYKESLSLNGDLTATLVYYTKSLFNNSSDYIYYYYNLDEKVEVDDMEDDIVYNLAAHRLERLGELDDGVIEEDLLKEQFSIIYGDNLKYEKISSFEYRCGKLIYDANYENYKKPVYYVVEKSKSCSVDNNIVATTIGSFVYDDRIEIVQAVGFVGEDGTYLDYRLQEKVTDDKLDENTMLGNDHLFKRYKYVFNYDKDDDAYYFKSVENYKGDI